MGKVVKLERAAPSAAGPRASRRASGVEDRARARRRRLHRRRVRDRRPARARPADGQPDRQRLRRLRRHERGLVRRRDGRQRGHARGDDARRRRARCRRRFRDVDLGNLLRPNIGGFAKQRDHAAAGAAALLRGVASASSARSRRWTSCSASPRPAGRRLLGRGHRGSTCTRCSTDPDRSDDFRCSAASSTSRRPTSTPASGSSSAPRAGTTCRSRPRCARRPRCRWSTRRSRCATASSSTAASSRRRTSTSPSTRARSSSSSSTRSSPTSTTSRRRSAR